MLSILSSSAFAVHSSVTVYVNERATANVDSQCSNRSLTGAEGIVGHQCIRQAYGGRTSLCPYCVKLQYLIGQIPTET